MQTSISCLQVFTVVYPSMVNNSETLKNLNGIKPDFFLHDFRVIHSAINEFSDSEMGQPPTLYTKLAMKNMKISLMEYQRL